MFLCHLFKTQTQKTAFFPFDRQRFLSYSVFLDRAIDSPLALWGNPGKVAENPWMVLLLILLSVLYLTSCRNLILPVTASAQITSNDTATHRDLRALPAPENRIPVAVYSFRDQTGQYKSVPNISSLSTAVTQGATSMMVHAVKDSGWFIPLEREELQNLLTERKIYRASAKKEASAAKKKKEEEEDLPALATAELILDGGILSYESNVVTGGLGAKYFGIGAAGEYRVDQVTVGLRAVDVQTGQVVLSVFATKSILSQKVDVSLFRYVSLKRILEVETGYTRNEPSQMCVREAIEKAVTSLVLEGVVSNRWQLRDPGDWGHPLLAQYKAEYESAHGMPKQRYLPTVPPLPEPGPEDGRAGGELADGPRPGESTGAVEVSSLTADGETKPLNRTRGIIRVSSAPAGTFIIIDDKFVAVTPFRFELPAGKHRLLLKKEGYQGLQAPLMVKSGAEIHISRDLVPLTKAQERQSGYPLLPQKEESHPQNRRATQDHPSPKKPFPSSPPANGSGNALPMGPPATEGESLSPEETARRRASPSSMQTAPQDRPGGAAMISWVDLTTKPSGALILVDGGFLGIAPYRFELASGPHVLNLEKFGFKTITLKFNVHPGKSLRIRQILTPLPKKVRPDQPPGKRSSNTLKTPDHSPGKRSSNTSVAPTTLMVESDPQGALLVVNGTLVGVTPYKGNIVPGTVRMVLKKVGFLDQEVIRRALPGSMTRVRTAMKAEGPGNR